MCREPSPPLLPSSVARGLQCHAFPLRTVKRADDFPRGMRFIGSIKADFLITHLAPDDNWTVIGRTKQDYVWIMARTPQIAERDYQALVEELNRQGFDTGKLRRVPQRWPERVPEQP